MDLRNNECISPMNILLVCSSGTPYVIQLWDNIKKRYPNVRFCLLTNDTNVDFYNERISLSEGEHIYYYHYDKLYINLRKTIKALPQFDIMHFLWIERQMGLLINELVKKTKKIYTSVGGSDLYRESEQLHVKMWQKRLLNRSDYFSSENQTTRDYFYTVYSEKYRNIPHDIVNFGVDILDSIDEIESNRIADLKRKWNIPSDKVVITLGYNGRREQQHLEMIEAITKLEKDIVDKFFFIIPMTYLVPSEEYVAEIIDRLSKITNQYTILREYMTTDEMAETVVISDVMIHVQTTDQLSSTMLAHMYNGNIVIAGAWLPYSDLKNAGVSFCSINQFAELRDILEPLASSSLTRYLDNRSIIYSMSSWDVAAKKWFFVYQSLYGNE